MALLLNARFENGSIQIRVCQEIVKANHYRPEQPINNPPHKVTPRYILVRHEGNTGGGVEQERDTQNLHSPFTRK